MALSLYRFSFKALGGPNEIQLYSSSEASAKEIADVIIADVLAVEARYSRYRSNSLVSKINNAAGSNNPIEVDDETAALFDYASLCYEQSNGMFDLTSGIFRRVWDFKKAQVPSSAEIEKLLPLVGWKKAAWRKPYFRLPLSGMELDLGGIGKEYCVDRAAGVALAQGVRHGLINLGGDLRAIGPHPDGSPWKVGIAHPRKNNSLLTHLDLYSGALATSGDYERFFELAGKRYCHIINPKTGFPVESFQSVSVLADSCLVAGSSATIAMLLGETSGLIFLRDSRLPFLIVDRSAKVSGAIHESTYLTK